jgi:hypothetical protein
MFVMFHKRLVSVIFLIHFTNDGQWHVRDTSQKMVSVMFAIYFIKKLVNIVFLIYFAKNGQCHGRDMFHKRLVCVKFVIYFINYRQCHISDLFHKKLVNVMPMIYFTKKWYHDHVMFHKKTCQCQFRDMFHKISSVSCS